MTNYLPIEDRSRFLRAHTRCQRERYLEYHSGPTGFGLRPVPLQMPLATGIHFHLVAADIMRVTKLAQDSGIIDFEILRAEYRRVIAEGSARYMNALKNRGFLELAEVADATEMFKTIKEQMHLIECLGWGFIRMLLPQILEMFEILEIEQEDELVVGCSCGLGDVLGHDIHAARNCDGVAVPTRPDLFLRNRLTGALTNVDFKTSSDVNSFDWKAQWKDNPQLALGSHAVSLRYGEPVPECYIIGLDKGYRAKTKTEFDVGRQKSGPARQESTLCYAYYRAGNPPFEEPDWRVAWEYLDSDGKKRRLQGKGYENVAVWEHPEGFPGLPEGWTIAEYWVAWLPEEELVEKFTLFGPIQNPVHLIPKLLRGMHATSWEWTQKLWEIWQAKEKFPEDSWAEARPEISELLDKLIPQSWDCYRYKKPCQFERVCKETLIGDPLTGGRFELRRPHHELELKRMIEAGVEPPKEQWVEEE